MKKSIALLIILTMVLSLTLTGCGQSADTPDSGTTGNDDSSADFDTGDSTIMDGTNDPDSAAEQETTHGDEDTSNADGYSYDVAGHTLVLRTNLDDYISDNFFLYDKLATDLGWRPRNPENAGNPDLMRYFYGDDNEYEVGFDSPLHQYYCHVYGDNRVTDSSGRFRFSDGSIDSHGPTYWVNRGGTMYTNFDQIVLLTYLLENTREAQNSSDLSAGLPTSGDLY